MADPFSITGSAVGVVSLAIQLCKGLEWYVSGVKDAKDKAEKIAADTEELTNLLELLETIVAKVDPSQSVSTTLTGIASCAEAIATIRKKLKLDNQAIDGGIKSSLKRLGRRMAFPFKEAEIEYWKGVLNTIQQSLQTALLALVIDQKRLASEDVRLRFTQLSLDQTAQHQASLQLQRVVFDKTRLQLAGHSQVVERGFTATSQSIRSLHADMNHTQDMLQPIMSLPQIEATLERLEATLSEMTCTTDSTLEIDMMNLKLLHRKNRRLKRHLAKVTCTCQTHTNALGYWSNWLTLACTRTSLHDPQCPLFPFQNTVTNLQFRVTLCSLFLGSKVSISLTLACGAGSPFKQTLECHRVVAKSSPAFSFIADLVESGRTTTEEVFRGEVNKLFEMFQLGQASPLDRLPDGRTLLHELGLRYILLVLSSDECKWNKNFLYLILTVVSRMSTEAFETDDSGSTFMDVLMRSTPPRLLHQEDFVTNVLLKHGLRITRQTIRTSSPSTWIQTTYHDRQSESSTDARLDENELVEAILSRSDHQLRHYLRQSKDMRTLNDRTVIFALRLATIHGWIDGCKIMLEANAMETLEEGSIHPREDNTLLGSLAYTKRLEMMQLWFLRRADFGQPQLECIGYAEDVYDSHECDSLPEFGKDIVYNMSLYLRNLRHEIDVLVKKHGIRYCGDNARSDLPDAHVRCMLTALVNKGVKVPQHYWPKRKSLHHRKACWCPMGRLVFERQESDGFREISGKDFRCSMETGCSPLVYFLTQSGPWPNKWRGPALIKRDMTVNWFLSKGADLRETWPRSDVTAMHCLAWQSAGHLRMYPGSSSQGRFASIQVTWDYKSFESLLKVEILDNCECGCSSSGCDFLTCLWKEFFDKTPYAYEGQFSVICDLSRGEGVAEYRHRKAYANILVELTAWVDRAANTLRLRRLIHGYMRLFVFSYLNLRHTCCDIDRIGHEDDPDYDKQPYPRYFPKEERRINNEDARLREILEELVPILISQFDAVGGRLVDFVINVMIPKMRQVAKELEEEDAALYAQGRRELGVVIYEDEDAEQSESGEEEEQDGDIEEESDDEY